MPSRPVVAVACSGGRDSVALLHATLAAGRELGMRVVALHVHHGLMAEADRWACEVEALCERWNADFACERLQGSPASGESIEAWARRERYRALARMARGAGASIVLLGHHLHDQAETVLLQALRGAGPAGLAAMPRVVERDGLTWARPWLARTGPEIASYAATLDVQPAIDPSNADPRFARSRLREHVMPALRAAFPEADVALAAVARRAGEARAVLDDVAAEDLRRIAAGEALPLAPWRALSIARRTNALRAWLAQVLDAPVPQTLVDRLLAETADDTTRRWLVGGDRVLRSWRGALALVALARACVTPAGARADGALSLLRCDRYMLDGWDGALEVFSTDGCGIAPHLLAHLVVRVRAGGEQFQLHPGGIARSLKKQYQALGIPAEGRDGPLLFDAAGALLFVPGLGVDARAWAPAGVPQWGLRWTSPAQAAKAQPV
ncbi:tRNA lysidine(34) synthetase TilS [Scleromatobacter humisilvae]|uniref:tRNA(Ile)-lysidine synthase n=1 Tax=Scleromatobacter humisilvae TaxID=2897159 RepID=A0A9X1YIL4_9BURK|nr:tRNA lysidine(34) synthetase TilS [Scleromatobacter humisilvae]MCK9686100.1 tRNA lysidine(34) synthetase TilS [Scleromatobacter humisilvae]